MILITVKLLYSKYLWLLVSGGKTSGQLLNPRFIDTYPPYGAIPGSNVSYDINISLIMVGLSYTFLDKK